MRITSMIAPTPQLEDESQGLPMSPGEADDLAERTLDDPSLKELLKEIHEGQYTMLEAAHVGAQLLILCECERIRRKGGESRE